MLLASWADDLVGLVAVSCLFGGGILTAIITAIAVNWRKVKESEHIAALKQSLSDRGMSAEEIERVIKVAPEGATASSDRPPVAELTELLADVQGLSPEDLERIIEAFQACDAATQRTIIKTLTALWPSDGSNPEPQKFLATVRALALKPGVQTTLP